MHHVKDAFTYRKWLVKVSFAQKTFFVSIKNVDAATESEAIECAARRAMLAYLEAGHPLGNLMDAGAFEDTPANRKTLNIDGVEVHYTYSLEWKNAA